LLRAIATGFWRRTTSIIVTIRAFAVLRVVLTALVLTTVAWAAPPPGADPNSELSQWFRGLRDDSGKSCCSLADCRPTEYRQLGDHYEVLVDSKWGIEPPQWVAVPPSKILNQIDNPTGRGVLCFNQYSHQVLCFVRPSET
jgi:hypothetical protein